MITTWLVIKCNGMEECVRQTLMDAAMQGFNPHYFAETPWLEYAYNSDIAIPTIQIHCSSQSEATRLRKKLREVCEPYEKRFPHPRKQGKELVVNPLDSRILFRYTDEDGNDLPAEQMPARIAG